MESSEQITRHNLRRETVELGVRDQVREYRVVLEKCGTASDVLKMTSVDNYQLEGRMNMTRETAYLVLLDAGYTAEEAIAYLEAIPRREIDEKVFVDAEKWDTDPYYRRLKENDFEDRLARLHKEVK
ncbi:MAG: hypothetical protein WCO79_02905 [bacterium]